MGELDRGTGRDEGIVGEVPAPRRLQDDRRIDVRDERGGLLGRDTALLEDLTCRVHQAVLGADLVDVEAEVVGWHRRFSFLSTLDTTTVWVERPFHAILLGLYGSYRRDRLWN